MDRTKTGALIAAARKEQEMTQKELAAAPCVGPGGLQMGAGRRVPGHLPAGASGGCFGAGVLDLLRGAGTAEVESDGQVLGAVRIVVREANKNCTGS
ncbi:MAG: hypothetical protein EP146_17915 [Oscillibacter sp.]|uniref:hypothetical protein n=1 Tax=Oscillibacter sp. TaxID=1945593 RepID=UPI001327C613|nr:hypothetical protein [Oscillibacter sp.]